MVQAYTKGQLGSFYLIADVGQLQGLRELVVHSKRVPAFVLANSNLQNRGLDSQVERSFLGAGRGGQQKQDEVGHDDSGVDNI